MNYKLKIIINKLVKAKSVKLVFNLEYNAWLDLYLKLHTILSKICILHLFYNENVAILFELGLHDLSIIPINVRETPRSNQRRKSNTRITVSKCFEEWNANDGRRVCIDTYSLFVRHPWADVYATNRSHRRPCVRRPHAIRLVYRDELVTIKTRGNHKSHTYTTDLVQQVHKCLFSS